MTSLIDISVANEYVKSGKNIRPLVTQWFVQDRRRREYDDEDEPWAFYCTKSMVRILRKHGFRENTTHFYLACCCAHRFKGNVRTTPRGMWTTHFAKEGNR